MPDNWYLGMRRVVRGAVAPFFILVTPFAVFLQYHGYGFLRPEVFLMLVMMAGLSLLAGAAAAISPGLETVALAGLLTIFVDLQFDPPKGSVGSAVIFLVLASVLWLLRAHASRIVTLMMATVLASSLLMPRSTAAAGQGVALPSSTRPASGSNDLPLILHVIVDEYIGFEGMPADLTPATFERDSRSFFDRHSFLVFGGAYSEYWNSSRSITHLVNLQPGGYVPTLFRPGTRSTWAVTRNEYFNRLAQRGYAVRVYQSNYLDLCGDQTSAPRCQSYAATSLRPLSSVALPVSQKALIVAGMYLNQSHLYSVLRGVYNTARQHAAAIVTLPSWNWERDRIGPLSSMPVVDAVASDLSSARRGDFVMAHLMMPHYPYAYKADCELRQPNEWLDRTDRDAPPGAINTPQSRATRYARYFEQVSCVHKQLDRLMTAIPPSLRRDAIVIIHGDHGSRISLIEPQLPGATRMSPADFADSYSTLFAVRSTQLAAGYDRRLMPITCLLRSLVQTEFRSGTAIEECATTPTVFMSAGDRFVATPLPPFRPAPRDARVAEPTQHVVSRRH